jgi:hypothetical protein
MLRSLTWTLCFLTLVAAGCVTGPDLARQRMEADYNCHQSDITVTELPALAYRVQGCGYTATYVCSDGKDNRVSCIKEAGSSPLPTSDADAGAR